MFGCSFPYLKMFGTDKGVGKLDPSLLLVEIENPQRFWEIVWQFLIKLSR
jgi:hypothetical protein